MCYPLIPGTRRSVWRRHRARQTSPSRACVWGVGEELAELRRMLRGRGEGAITQSGAVHGLGGMGKTTLAAHYANQHLRLRDYPLVWWINAVSSDSIEQSLAALAHRLVPEWAGLANPQDVAPYTGALRGGDHLATSRRTASWPDNAPTLTLGNLEPHEATALLCRLAFKGHEVPARKRADAAALATARYGGVRV